MVRGSGGGLRHTLSTESRAQRERQLSIKISNLRSECAKCSSKMSSCYIIRGRTPASRNLRKTHVGTQTIFSTYIQKISNASRCWNGIRAYCTDISYYQVCQSREKRYRKFFQVWKCGGNIKTAHQHQQQQQQHQQKSIRSVLWEGESVSVRVPGIHPVDIYTYSMSNPRRTSTVWAYLVAWIYVLPIYFLLIPSTRYLVYTYSITGDHINSK